MPGRLDRPIRVLWLIKGLGPGGAERLLVSFAEGADHERFSYSAGYLLPWKDQLVPALESAGVAVHCLDGPRSADPRWVGRLRRLLRSERFDVVHIHSPLVAAFARPVVRFAGSRPRPALVYTEHNEWAGYAAGTHWASRLTFALDDAQLAVSEQSRLSMPPRLRPRVEVLIQGVPVAEVAALRDHRSEVRRELGVGEDDVLIGTVANYRHDKDYPTLLVAARAVVDANPSVRFVAVGQGPRAEAIEGQHRQLGLGDRFQLLGYRAGASRVMAGFDIFTLSSLREGYPVALMEALALGLPIVATAVGGIADAVRPGREGMLVPAGQPRLLAQEILRLVQDPGLRAEMGRAARARADDFDIRRAIERTEELYQGLSRTIGSSR